MLRRNFIKTIAASSLGIFAPVAIGNTVVKSEYDEFIESWHIIAPNEELTDNIRKVAKSYFDYVNSVYADDIIDFPMVWDAFSHTWEAAVTYSAIANFESRIKKRLVLVMEDPIYSETRRMPFQLNGRLYFKSTTYSSDIEGFDRVFYLI